MMTLLILIDFYSINLKLSFQIVICSIKKYMPKDMTDRFYLIMIDPM